MRKFLLLVLLAALVITPMLAQDDEGPVRTGIRPDAPPYGVRGPYWVGVMEMVIEGEGPVDMTIWYPALNPDGLTEEITYTYYDYQVSDELLPVFGRALKDAEPATGGPYPLVIFLHAGYQGAISSTYLTEHLASHGFVVLSMKHIDSGDWSVPASLTTYSRLEHIPWLIEYGENLASADGALAELIDMEHIALVGSGAGAEASLLAVGSRMDLNSPESMCMLLDAEMSEFCTMSGEVLLTHTGLESMPDGLWPSWADPRIDAVVPLGPFVRFLGPESLKDVTTPILFIVPSLLMQIEQYRTYMYDTEGSTNKLFVVYEGATPTILGNRCDRMPWLLDQFYAFCADPVWDMDRAHDLINHFVTAFLMAELYGDEDARAALAPDAVSFPGIGYEAVGY